MTLDEAERLLQGLSESVSDAILQWQLSQLLSANKNAARHSTRGSYFDAKYSAAFVDRLAQELEADSRIDAEASAALEVVRHFADGVLKLPDGERPAPGPYSERYPVGSTVRIASLKELEEFKITWKFHHAPIPEQLEYAGMITVVQTVGYYHGGDVVYTLEGTGNYAWLEPCLRDLEPGTNERP